MPDNLVHVISELIALKEEELNYELTPENRDFLTATLIKTIRRGVDKYVKGAIEHGENFLTEVDHNNESFNEAVDLLMYINAAILKQHKFDKRYDS